MTDDKPAKHADFRGRLAQELLDAQEDALQVLRDAMKADTEGKDWFTITCKHCHRQGKYELTYQLPAHKERLAALQMWTDQGLGKAAQAAKAAQEGPPLDIRYEDLPTDEAKTDYRQKLLRLASAPLVSALSHD